MCFPVSPSSALLKRINMLALQQMTPQAACVPSDDNNNSCLSPSALKVLTLPKSGLRRCLFGVPKVEDNVRIIQEDRKANRARMAKLWSWDVTNDAPETSGSWVWEKVKKRTPTSTPLSKKSFAPISEYRHHPYPGTVRVERTSSETSTTIDFQLPSMILPIPPTPVVTRVRRNSTSSTSTTSSTSGDEDEVESSELSTLSTPSSSSETWSPRFATQISCSVKVQTRLTDFWRSRRSSCSESKHTKSPALAIEKNVRTGEMACSV